MVSTLKKAPDKKNVAAKLTQFESLDEYREFFRGFQDEGTNGVTMFVPSLDPKQPATLTRCLVTNPDNDFRLVDDVLGSDDFKDAKWTIQPVRITEERKQNTDRLTYRVRLRRPLIPEYRNYMRDGAFFPLLVFDADRQFWISGRHRAEAAEKDYNAAFAMVFEGLTEAQVLIISDATNRWHAEHWDDDELAALAYGYVKEMGWNTNKALSHVGLDHSHSVSLLGVALWRKYPDINQSFKPGTSGGGHPRTLKTLGRIVHLFGKEAAIKALSYEEWKFIISDKMTLSKVMAAYKSNQLFIGSRKGVRSVLGWGGDVVDLTAYRLNGTPRQRYEQFVKLTKKAQQPLSRVKAGISDDQRFLTFVSNFLDLSDGQLASIKGKMTTTQRKEVREFVRRLDRIF